MINQKQEEELNSFLTVKVMMKGTEKVEIALFDDKKHIFFVCFLRWMWISMVTRP